MKRIRWQCGCYDSGGKVAQEWFVGDPDVDKMKEALSLIANASGCECDSYHGHRCKMCEIRSIARQALK